jgi:hypothetical protein
MSFRLVAGAVLLATLASTPLAQEQRRGIFLVCDMQRSESAAVFLNYETKEANGYAAQFSEFDITWTTPAKDGGNPVYWRLIRSSGMLETVVNGYTISGSCKVADSKKF